MAEKVRLWRIADGDELREFPQSHLNLEARIEDWLARDISVLDPALLVIGKQVETDFGGIIDLLCLDRVGDVVVVELKRDRTPREITAQVLDYGSWIKDLSNERITAIADEYLRGEFEDTFKLRFGSDVPETLNENHKLLVVGSEIDASSERIIKYLSESYGVNINAATFQYFKDETGSEFLARVFLSEPSQVELQSRTKGSSKRRPNLTPEELEGVAQERGVADLYRRAVTGLERYLQKQRTPNSIRFATRDGSRKVVVVLIPEESNATDGLRFRAYSLRLRALLNLSEEALEMILPPHREPYETGEQQYEGFEGFFASQAEIERFVSGFDP
jgi:hypothetical protein